MTQRPYRITDGCVQWRAMLPNLIPPFTKQAMRRAFHDNMDRDTSSEKRQGIALQDTFKHMGRQQPTERQNERILRASTVRRRVLSSFGGMGHFLNRDLRTKLQTPVPYWQRSLALATTHYNGGWMERETRKHLQWPPPD